MRFPPDLCELDKRGLGQQGVGGWRWLWICRISDFTVVFPSAKLTVIALWLHWEPPSANHEQTKAKQDVSASCQYSEADNGENGLTRRPV